MTLLSNMATRWNHESSGSKESIKHEYFSPSPRSFITPFKPEYGAGLRFQSSWQKPDWNIISGWREPFFLAGPASWQQWVNFWAKPVFASGGFELCLRIVILPLPLLLTLITLTRLWLKSEMCFSKVHLNPLIFTKVYFSTTNLYFSYGWLAAADYARQTPIKIWSLQRCRNDQIAPSFPFFWSSMIRLVEWQLH